MSFGTWETFVPSGHDTDIFDESLVSGCSKVADMLIGQVTGYAAEDPVVMYPEVCTARDVSSEQATGWQVSHVIWRGLAGSVHRRVEVTL